MAVEYRDAKAKLLQVTAATDIADLAVVKALYVTVSAKSRKKPSGARALARELSEIKIACGLAGTGDYGGLEDLEGDEEQQLGGEDAGDDDDDLDDGASSVLVDLSLAGCCGVRSTHGGLTIQSDHTTPLLTRSASDGSASRSSRGASGLAARLELMGRSKSSSSQKPAITRSSSSSSSSRSRR